MTTGFKNSVGSDLDTIFIAGSGGSATGYKRSDGSDLSQLLHPYYVGTKGPATGYKLSDGRDLSDRFWPVGVASWITRSTVNTASRVPSYQTENRGYYEGSPDLGSKTLHYGNDFTECYQHYAEENDAYYFSFAQETYYYSGIYVDYSLDYVTWYSTFCPYINGFTYGASGGGFGWGAPSTYYVNVRPA